MVDRKLKLGGHRVAFDTAVTSTREHVGPPLQAHLAGKRLAHHLPYPRNLDIEGVDRQYPAALFSRQEQRGGVTAKIVAADQLRAMLGGLRAFVGAAHGTAISAAATRRRSPIMML